MSKNEFLEKLKEALANDLDPAAVREQVDFYSQYIDGEIGSGRTEGDVTEELGDPWAIARTIIDSSGTQDYARDADSYASRSRGEGERRDSRDPYGQIRVSRFHAAWRVLLAVLGIVGIIMLAAAVIGGIISILAPILVPLFFILAVVRMIKERRK